MIIPDHKIHSALKNADKDVAILVKSGGTLENGQVYWAYAAILPSRYKALKEAEKQGGYELEDFGDVLFWGYGEIPSDVKKEIEKILIASENFEAELYASVNSAIKSYAPGFSEKLLARKLLG